MVMYLALSFVPSQGAYRLLHLEVKVIGAVFSMKEHLQKVLRAEKK